MTTQPQSPSEQFEQQLKTQMRDVLLKSGQYLNVSYVEPDLGAWRQQMETILSAHKVAIAQAADKREQEVLDDLTEYYQGLLADRPATVKFPAWIGKNELQAWIDGRQGKAAEGEGKNA